MKQVLVFDLDDTLYDEITFVKSGFRAVARFLEEKYQVPLGESYEFMVDDLRNGRGKIFNNLLDRYQLNTQGVVKKCLTVYRTHQPDISLSPDAVACLQRFAQYPKYIVTDGNKVVQHNKLVALGLYPLMKKCFVTHRFGVANAKPSPYCFLKISKMEKADPANVVYVADNPKKDFVNIKPLGFKTVRIMKGDYQYLNVEEKFDAQFKITTLDELDESFLNKVFNLKG